ncbi:glycosyltransferase [Dyadobacter psychrotolerans]|uniref:Glycosyltransferase family 1 protein n=1 Tax=Dyadobacter psychrotolerans TaxID=2541721 RepID=A0A4V2Z2V2_9BACT|nr:glycosyltransferase [Dyadobacter psychrotolerans]TDE10228.1 glycosyltransferase family 1 protein [Dyadobacter psychrotolerans]
MILNGKQIVIFGLPRLDSQIESTNYTTAKYLAKTNKVFYVENPYTIKDYFKLKNSPAGQRRKGLFSIFNTDVIETELPGLSVIVPPVLLSINFLPEGAIFRAALKVNEVLLAFKLKRFWRKYAVKDFIFINSFNFHYPALASYFKPVLEVYHSLDPLILPFDSKHGLISEEYLIKRSDIVLCSSKALYEEKIKINPNTFFVPNAADLTHSMKVLDPQTQVSKLLDVPKPAIGYFGAIERRIDYAMLAKVAKLNTDKTFVFVGPVSEEFVPEDFKSLKNVKFTGPVPYSEMPSVVKGFDVALIPFKKDDVSRTIFPLKLFEYLGAGKPVVCTDFNPDLAEFTGDTVRFSSDADGFSKAINEALLDNSPSEVEKRLAVASANTWGRRIDEIAEILFNALKKKSVRVAESG